MIFLSTVASGTGYFNVVTTHIRDIAAGRQDFSGFLQDHDPTVLPDCDSHRGSRTANSARS